MKAPKNLRQAILTRFHNPAGMGGVVRATTESGKLAVWTWDDREGNDRDNQYHNHHAALVLFLAKHTGWPSEDHWTAGSYMNGFVWVCTKND